MSISKHKYAVGDWLSFSKDNHVVIGQVCYMHRTLAGSFVYVTTAGTVDEQRIHECRPAKSGIVRPYDTKVRL
jgi:hypothetical protein